MKTDDLIDRLARDATAVALLPAPRVRTVTWLLWAALYLVAVAAIMRITTSAGGATITPLYLLQQGGALLTGVAAARAAFISVVPGAPMRARSLLAISAAVWVCALLWEVGADLRTAGTMGLTSQTDWLCVVSLVLGGIVVGAPLLWMVSGGAPLTPRTTAFLAGLAALSVANIEACLTRSHPFAITVLLWHGATIVIASTAVGFFGRRWLRWPT